jgi:hypothetical protein
MRCGVYVLGPIERHYKVGSTYDVYKRCGQLKLPIEIKETYLIKTPHYLLFERWISVAFADIRGNGEWYRFGEQHLDCFQALSELKEPLVSLEQVPELLKRNYKHNAEKYRYTFKNKCLHYAECFPRTIKDHADLVAFENDVPTTGPYSHTSLCCEYVKKKFSP